MSDAKRRVSEREEHARRLFSGLPGTYDGVGALLSFGQDPRWRRFMVSRVRAPANGLALDVATGTAAVALRLARRNGLRVVALDQSEPMLREGVRRVERAGLADRVRPVLGHGDRLPFPDATFDVVTFTYLLRYVDDPAPALAELTRVLRPGGTLANLEFHVPPGRAARLAWRAYTRVGLPVAGRTVGRHWGEVGRFLGPSIEGFYREYPLGRQLADWRRAGILGVRARLMSLGGGVVIWGRRA